MLAFYLQMKMSGVGTEAARTQNYPAAWSLDGPTEKDSSIETWGAAACSEIPSAAGIGGIANGGCSRWWRSDDSEYIRACHASLNLQRR